MSRIVRVVPSILTDSQQELACMVTLANGFAPVVQLDIMDGEFVPTRSVGVADVAGVDIRFVWEAHLMVSHPLEHMDALRKAGAARVIFHIESDDDAEMVVSHARTLGMSVGVAINPPTPVADVVALLPRVDSVLLMAVYPGYYGAPFVPDVLCKIADLRMACPKIEIGIDGGIKESNLVAVARWGVDTVCIGSAVFGTPDPAASYHRLAGLAREV